MMGTSKMNIRINNQAGFTLAELLIFMLLTGILLSGIVTLLSTSVITTKRGNSLVEVQQTARAATDAIARELRYAQAGTIVIGNGSGEVTDNKSITFVTDQAGAVRYYQDGNGVLRRNSGGGGQPVTGQNTSINDVKIDVVFSWGDSHLPAEGRRLVNIRLTAFDGAASLDSSAGRNYTIETSITIMNTRKNP